MDVLQTTSRERETYQVKLHYSILWECALGIAAITNTRLLDTLDKPKEYWGQIRESISTALSEELEFVEKIIRGKHCSRYFISRNFQV